jgi:hypothetical protein
VVLFLHPVVECSWRVVLGLAEMLFGGGGGGRRKGPDAHVAVDVTLEELYNGGERSAR